MSVGNLEQDGADILRLRFVGKEEDGAELRELRAAHVAEVLQGLVGLTSEFEKAGAFGSGPPGEVLVRPAQEGSFIIEVLRTIQENPDLVATGAGAAGVPSIGSIVWWATKSVRADVKDFEYLENGNVKVEWQDESADEVPREVWVELNKRKRRRKRYLRQILAPLSDDRVSALKVSDEDDSIAEAGDAPEQFTLERLDYHLTRPEDEIEEKSRVFKTEAQMSAIDFDSPDRWRVKTKDANRLATMEDAGFLLQVDRGLALHKDDIFNLRIREDAETKNGRTRRAWTVLEVTGHRRRSQDDNGA